MDIQTFEKKIRSYQYVCMAFGMDQLCQHIICVGNGFKQPAWDYIKSATNQPMPSGFTPTKFMYDGDFFEIKMLETLDDEEIIIIPQL